ncbi:MAG: SDR family oxidoreductase [Planctomycetota bacterium]|jgi:3-oxoacyl-[acyl-carrier protein] reductase|nr:SDR family oxidoreductase [Planctomycetota bacterium]
MMSQEEPLAGKTAWVTGSGRGIGRAYAERLLKLGARVAIHDLSEEAPSQFEESKSLSEVAEELGGLGDVVAVSGDLTEENQVRRMAAEIREQATPVDILVNNAGGDIAADGNKAEPNDCVFISEIDASSIMDRNLKSAILCCQAVSPDMMASGYGRIINIASNAAFHGCAWGSMYAVAKAAVNHFTRCLAAQVRSSGVTVNCIAPGNTPTARFMATRKVDEKWLNSDHPLERPCQPDDLANVMEFLVTDLGSFVSGQVISVDGGGRLVAG